MVTDSKDMTLLYSSNIIPIPHLNRCISCYDGEPKCTGASKVDSFLKYMRNNYSEPNKDVSEVDSSFKYEPSSMV